MERLDDRGPVAAGAFCSDPSTSDGLIQISLRFCGRRLNTGPPTAVENWDVVAAAMIDRLVHHAEILSLKGDSYRLRDRDLGGRPPAREPETA